MGWIIFKLLFTILISQFSECQQEGVILYEHFSAGPTGLTRAMPIPKAGACDVVAPLGNGVSSAQTTACIQLWDGADCTGRMLEIKPPGNPDFGPANFHEITHSMSACKKKQKEKQPPKKGKGKKVIKVVKKKQCCVIGG